MLSGSIAGPVSKCRNIMLHQPDFRRRPSRLTRSAHSCSRLRRAPDEAVEVAVGHRHYHGCAWRPMPLSSSLTRKTEFPDDSAVVLGDEMFSVQQPQLRFSLHQVNPWQRWLNRASKPPVGGPELTL